MTGSGIIFVWCWWSIALLFDLLDPECLDGLLGPGREHVAVDASPAAFNRYRPDKGDGPVRLIHPSMHDFLIDVVRCSDVNFVVDARGTAYAPCRAVLASPAEPIPGYVQDRRRIDPQSRVKIYQTGSQRMFQPMYSMHVDIGASHLSSGVIRNSTLDLLHRFCSRQLLNWLEVMVCLGGLGWCDHRTAVGMQGSQGEMSRFLHETS